MRDVATTVDDRIAECLSRHAQMACPAGTNSWEIALPDLPNVRVRADSDWLSFRARVAAHDRTQISERKLSQALRANGYILGTAKVALCSKTGERWLLSDIPIDAEGDLDGPIAECCDSLRQLARMLNGGEDSPAVAASRPKRAGDAMTDDTRNNLIRQCQEAGWSCTTRPDGRVLVPLEVPDAFCQASVERVDSRWTRVAVEWGLLPMAGVCRLAAAWFLLSASYHVRWLRPVIEDANGQETCRWEVLLPNPVDSRPLDRALTAFSMACQLSVHEFEALRNEDVASWFVTLQIPNCEGGFR